MKKAWVTALLFLLLGAACTTSPATVPVEDGQTAPEQAATQPAGEQVEATQASLGAEPQFEPGAPFEGATLPIDRTDLFSGAGGCVACHSNMVDESGADVSIDRMWRSSMMANAARDPYWQASVRAEVERNPDLQAVIEDKCATCHLPMARTELAAAGEKAALIDQGLLNPANQLHAIGIDGISCNACHQIEVDNFGTPDGFSGGYVIDTQRPMGERHSYGPYQVGQQLASTMQSVSGFIPLQASHLKQSEMCGTCHTLYTPYLDSNDQIAGEFPEQTVYPEWQNSDFSQSDSCQSCHMPAAQGGVKIATTGGQPRSPFSQHVSVGGNAFMQQIFLHFGPEMNVTASSEHFNASLTSILDQLQNRTAAVELSDLTLEGDQLIGVVKISSLVGHKFPAGFPSRRAWLHILVQDGDGEVIFESGAFSPDGAIQGNDNDDDPARFEPHYTVIDNSEQVQIYESIMADTEGQVTTTLLRAASYVKDNRLLPVGFDKTSVEADIAPYGAAVEDADFQAAGDRLELALDVAGAEGPFTISVELLYQSIGYRWAHNLADIDAPEVARFLGYYQAVPNLPVVVAEAQAEVVP